MSCDSLHAMIKNIYIYKLEEVNKYILSPSYQLPAWVALLALISNLLYLFIFDKEWNNLIYEQQLELLNFRYKYYSDDLAYQRFQLNWIALQCVNFLGQNNAQKKIKQSARTA